MQEIRELIQELGRDHTVILSSHILTEISAVCDTIIIISNGRIVASDTIENLTASTDGCRIITLDIRGDIQSVTKALATLENVVNTTVTHGLGGCVHVIIETPANTDMRENVFRLFAQNDLPILDMSTNDVSLEDVFLRLTSSDAPLVTDEMEECDDEQDEMEDTIDDTTDAEDSDEDDYTPLFGPKN